MYTVIPDINICQPASLVYDQPIVLLMVADLETPQTYGTYTHQSIIIYIIHSRSYKACNLS